VDATIADGAAVEGDAAVGVTTGVRARAAVPCQARLEGRREAASREQSAESNATGSRHRCLHPRHQVSRSSFHLSGVRINPARLRSSTSRRASAGVCFGFRLARVRQSSTEAPMPRSLELCLGCLILASGSLAFADGSASKLSHQGHPLHPRCVTDLVAGEGAAEADLKKCASAPGKVVVRDGWLEWDEPRAAGQAGRGELSAYHVLGSMGGDAVVEYRWSGGGTGVFSGLAIVRLSGDKLVRVQSMVGGDRCNGGLVSAKVAGEDLSYSINATPPDVIHATAAGRALQLKDYEDLEASAMSCVAVIEFAYRKTGSEPTGVTLGGDLEDRKGWTEKYRLQACYNALQRSYVKDGKVHLDAAALDGFVREFGARCLKGQ
jgi:hypothetical protein